MLFIFEVRVKEGYTVEEYAEAWVRASEIIQQTTGARGTYLHRKIGDPDTLLAIAHWTSKADRDAKDDQRDATVNVDYVAPLPSLLVFQLSTKLAPTLIQDRFIQTAFGGNFPARLVERAGCRFRHIPHLQVFQYDHGLVIADPAGKLVKEVLAALGDFSMESCDAALLPLPIVREFLLF